LAHGHHHPHHAHHGHSHPNRAFAFGVSLNLLFTVVQVVAGLMSHSLALLADAAHNLTDVLGLLLAWGADTLSRRKPTERRTYGYRGTTILAALVNAVVLFVAVGAVAWEAIRRFGQPNPVDGVTVMWVAALGVVVNTATALPFLKGAKNDLNLRAAFLHLAADAAVSVGVLLTGFAITRTGALWLDPLVSLLIGVVIIWGTWGVLRDSFNLALAAVPSGVDIGSVRAYLEGLRGVEEVHDLHIWGMSTTETAMTVHLVMKKRPQGDRFLKGVMGQLDKKFGIHHATVQMETGGLKTCCALESGAKRCACH
jgi:cobalt-zinc-cadmium efflux system protein